jgi:hypothetical protein
MLIPRFTVRQLLVLTTVCALFALAASLAQRGHAWAQAVTAAVGALIAAALMSAALFFAAWLISLVFVSSESNSPRLPSPDRKHGGPEA